MGIVFNGEKYLTPTGYAVDFVNMTTNNRYVSTQQAISTLKNYNPTQINNMIISGSKNPSLLTNNNSIPVPSNYVMYFEYFAVIMAFIVIGYWLYRRYG